MKNPKTLCWSSRYHSVKKRDKNTKLFVRSENIFNIVEFFQNFSLKSLRARQSLSIIGTPFFPYCSHVKTEILNSVLKPSLYCTTMKLIEVILHHLISFDTNQTLTRCWQTSFATRKERSRWRSVHSPYKVTELFSPSMALKVDSSNILPSSIGPFF